MLKKLFAAHHENWFTVAACVYKTTVDAAKVEKSFDMGAHQTCFTSFLPNKLKIAHLRFFFGSNMVKDDQDRKVLWPRKNPKRALTLLLCTSHPDPHYEMQSVQLVHPTIPPQTPVLLQQKDHPSHRSLSWYATPCVACPAIRYTAYSSTL